MNQTGVVVVVVLCLKQWHSLDQIPFLFQSETDGAAVLVPVFSLVSHTHSLEYKWLFYSPTGTRVQHQNLRTNTGERWENRTGNDVWSPRSWFISESETMFPSLLTVREEKKNNSVLFDDWLRQFSPTQVSNITSSSCEWHVTASIIS